MADKILTTNQRVSLYITPVDAAGNYTPMKNIHWTVSDTTVIELNPSVDGQAALAKGLKVGTATVTATNGTLSATYALQVVLPDAVSFTINSSGGMTEA